MSDTMEVMRPCDHGKYEPHAWIELKSDGWQKWCDGGKRIMLRPYDKVGRAMRDQIPLWVVEGADDE